MVAAIGAQLIYLLIRLFGRTHARKELAWLDGPFGGDTIGDAPYQEAEPLGVGRALHCKLARRPALPPTADHE